jgi:hypothetical protein
MNDNAVSQPTVSNLLDIVFEWLKNVANYNGLRGKQLQMNKKRTDK